MNESASTNIDGDMAGCRIAIVMSQYNRYIVDRLEQACLESLKSAGIGDDKLSIVRVPGAYEIPVTVSQLLEHEPYDAIITLGAIIRGETPHFDIIANSCSQEIMRIGTNSGIPVIFGVLTVDSAQQALDRSGDEESNKGAEAAQTALQMIAVLRQIRHG